MAVLGNPQKLLTFTGINVFVGDIIRHVTTINDQLDRVVERYAKRVERDAKVMAPQPGINPYATGRLRDSITSWRVDKAVWMVGPRGTPHAIFVEYGVPARNIPPRPFLRPALDKHADRFERACAKLAGPVREAGDLGDAE